VVGHGSFGVVVRATVQEKEGETVAIKKVLQDKRYKVQRTYFHLIKSESRIANHAATKASKYCRTQEQFLY
jgi:hypothetical protein